MRAPEAAPIYRLRSVTKAQELLGWMPPQTMEAGIRDAVSWYLAAQVDKGS
jgi:nucleoside-diphosphate-sugar epimerase